MRGAVTYEIRPDVLVLKAGSGQRDKHYRWRDITDAAVVETFVRGGLHLRRIDLFHGAAKTRLSISCTSFSAGRTLGDNAVEHLMLMARIAQQLGAVHNGFEITFGEYGKGRLAIFVIGVLTLLSGLGFILLVLGTGVSQDRLWDVAAPVVVLLIFGGGLVYTKQPWRKLPKLDARVMAEILRNSI